MRFFIHHRIGRWVAQTKVNEIMTERVSAERRLRQKAEEHQSQYPAIKHRAENNCHRFIVAITLRSHAASCAVTRESSRLVVPQHLFRLGAQRRSAAENAKKKEGKGLVIPQPAKSLLLAKDDIAQHQDKADGVVV